MVEILHRLQIDAPPRDVYRLLVADAEVQDRLLASPFFGMRVVAALDDAKIVWRCEHGPEEWRGTEVTIELAPDGEGAAVLRLSHAKWHASTDVMADCATRWARTLFALKARAETPDPDDLDTSVRVDARN